LSLSHKLFNRINSGTGASATGYLHVMRVITRKTVL
jgi:hypothetical protein